MKKAVLILIVTAIVGFYVKVNMDGIEDVNYTDVDYTINKGSFDCIMTELPIEDYKIQFYQIKSSKNLAEIVEVEYKKNQKISEKVIDKKSITEKEKVELLNFFKTLEDTYDKNEAYKINTYGYYLEYIIKDNDRLYICKEKDIDKFLEIVKMKLTMYSDPYSY